MEEGAREEVRAREKFAGDMFLAKKTEEEAMSQDM